MNTMSCFENKVTNCYFIFNPSIWNHGSGKHVNAHPITVKVFMTRMRCITIQLD